jgi:hypothetical protein
MALTISSNTLNGVTLTNAGYNPVAVASGVTVANPAGIGIQSTASVYWAISNASGATISGQAFGVSLANAGSVVNQGNISAGSVSGNGYSYSSVTGDFTASNAAVFVGGGGVSNAAGGVIAGSGQGVALGGEGSFVNAGTVSTTGLVVGSTLTNTFGFSVVLASGGSVVNLPGGTITGAAYGVLTVGNAYLGNRAGGTIASQAGGLLAVHGDATVVNQGFISGSRFAGLRLTGGGSVLNQATGTVSGYEFGILAEGTAATAITNAGSVIETSTSRGFGVLLTAGQLTNTGLIQSNYYGAYAVAGTATITNTGTIESSRTLAGAGVAVNSGGTVINGLGGEITGEWIGVQSGTFSATSTVEAPLLTIDNLGAISAADGKGDGAAVWLHGPGVVLNAVSGVIEGSTNGTIVGGPLSGLANGGFGIVAYYQTTVINYGSIGGARYAFLAANKNPGNTIGNLIEMAPGASFGGIVLAANGQGSGTLELLSGPSVGTVSEFGTISHSGSSYQGYVGFGQVAIANGASWSLGGTVSSGTTIAFAPGGTGALTLANPASVQGTITGFGLGDTLSLVGVSATGISLSSSGNVASVEGTGLTLDFAPGQSFSGEHFVEQVVNGQTVIELACFASGTLIRTDQGDVAVEQLRAGMVAITAGGEPARIKWIGHRRVDCVRHPKPEAICPVLVCAGAFGPQRPARDLRLSPDHAVFVEGVLIPVKFLLNGATIRQEQPGEVTYWHVELDRHEVILAEGLPCETYLDTDNRGSFANGAGVKRWHAAFAPEEAGAAIWEAASCAPLRIEGPEVARTLTRLGRRARRLGNDVSRQTRRRSIVPSAGVICDLTRLLRPRWYLTRYRDVAADQIDPVAHYSDAGRAEGRLPCPEIELVRRLGLVDPGLVVFTMADVVLAGVDAVAHFCTSGWREGRRPNRYFDPAWYQGHYDVPAGMNPLLHYVLFGEAQGFAPSRHFDPAWYRLRYDLAPSVSALAHYLKHCRTQLVSPTASFDVAVYRRAQGARLQPNRDAYAHFLAFGGDAPEVIDQAA